MQQNQQQGYNDQSKNRSDPYLPHQHESINTDPREQSGYNNDIDPQAYEQQLPPYTLPESRFERGEKVNSYQAPASARKPPKRKRTWLSTLIAVILILALLGGINHLRNIVSTSNMQVVAEEKRTFTVQENATLRIDNQSGNITISTWQNNQIEIRAISEAGGPEFTRQIPDIDYKTTRPDLIEIDVGNSFLNLFSAKKVHFEIFVPASIQLDLDINVGKVNIDGVTGIIEVDKNMGDITINNSNIKDESEIKTNAGNVTLINTNLSGTGEIETNAGNIKFQGDLEQNARYTLDSNAGNVIVGLSENQIVCITGSTNAGNIESDFDELDIDKGFGSTEIDGFIKGIETETELKLETNAGNIEVNRQ